MQFLRITLVKRDFGEADSLTKPIVQAQGIKSEEDKDSLVARTARIIVSKSCKRSVYPRNMAGNVMLTPGGRKPGW